VKGKKTLSTPSEYATRSGKPRNEKKSAALRKKKGNRGTSGSNPPREKTLSNGLKPAGKTFRPRGRPVHGYVVEARAAQKRKKRCLWKEKNERARGPGKSGSWIPGGKKRASYSRERGVEQGQRHSFCQLRAPKKKVPSMSFRGGKGLASANWEKEFYDWEG